MKWDLILKSDNNSLCVNDFHLSPISHNTPYTHKSDEYLILNSHQDNVKKYFSENKGNFYKENINSEFTHNYPIICDNDNDVIDCYSNIYDMGCKRAKQYNIYKKQFEFFCPLWLEHIPTDSTLKFKIDIKNTDNTILSSNTLVLDNTNISNKYHKKFVTYFNNYIKDSGLDQGSDDLINIKFDKNTATITGLDLTSGLFKTKNIEDIVYNITSRERPLMEVDDMLIRSFENNNLICKQLFNFNLCFNLEDIFSKNIAKLLYSNQVIISVTAYINDTELELKDFYTDYEYIRKQVYGDTTKEYTENVLDYLKDNEYIEFINKNKFCQSICHWSLCENNDYIFNVYEGFSGLYIEDGEIYENEHQYGNAPNTLIEKFDKSRNTAGWISVKTVNEWSDFYKYILATDTYKTEGTYINSETKYINNIKYGYSYKPENDDTDMYLIGLVVTKSNILININQVINESDKIQLGNDIIIYKIKNLMMLITSDINNLSFAAFFKKLNNYIPNNSTNADLTELYKIMKSMIPPSLITFNKSLLYSISNTKFFNSTEIDYLKNDKFYNYILRYDGKIKPSFGTNNYTLYYKDYISSDKLKKSIYGKYSILNYEPLYPSIGYCAIKKINNDDWNYNEIPSVVVSNFSENDKQCIYKYNIETKWYNNNKVLVLNPEINFTYITLDSESDKITLDEIIQAHIKKYYNITDNDKDKYEYIRNLYTYENKWDYISDTDITNYIYNITLKLK